MADLDQILGAILSSMAQARRIADEQTSAIAQYYQNNPLLKGMTVPRIRLPEVVLDVPMLVEAADPGSAPVFAPPAELTLRVTDAAVEAAASAGMPIDAAQRAHLQQVLQDGLAAAMREAGQGKTSPELVQEALQRVADKALSMTVDDMAAARNAGSRASAARAASASAGAQQAPEAASPPAQSGPDAQQVRKAVLAAAREAVRRNAVAQPGRAATLRVNVLTREIKDQGNPQAVTRLKLVLREEGMEWQETQQADGSRTAWLSPE